MWNQESHLDHLLLVAAISTPFRALYNIEVAHVPLFGDYLRRAGNYLIDRHDEAQWRASLAQAAKDIRESGITLLLSPEGTRSWDGELLSLKRGGFLLTVAAQAPIVPLTLVGGYERLPRTAMVVRPGKIWAIFGKPIETSGCTDEDIGRLQAQVAEVFQTTKAKYKHLV